MSPVELDARALKVCRAAKRSMTPIRFSLAALRECRFGLSDSLASNLEYRTGKWSPRQALSDITTNRRTR
jgi:hypothetical protein